METNESEKDFGTTIGLRTSESYSAQLGQYVTDVPSETKSDVDPQPYTLTSDSAEELASRKPITGRYKMNLPITNPVMTISRIYKPLHAMAFNYDREHYGAFYQAWKGLKVLHDTESWIDADTLKEHEKQLTKRISHRAYYYSVAVMNYYASFVNMAIYTRYEDPTVFKDLAYQFRWGVLNSNSALLKDYPVPLGFSDWLVQLARFVVGKTSYQSEVVLVPYFNTTPFGNFGWHTPSLDDLWAATGNTDTGRAEYWPVGNCTEGEDSFVCEDNDAMRRLLANMQKIAEQYGYKADASPKAVMPPLENGGAICVKNAGKCYRFPTNRWGNGLKYRKTEHDISVSAGDQLVDNLWETFRFWQNIMFTQFADFADSESDVSVFFKTQLKMLEDPLPAKDIIKVIGGNKYVSLKSYMEACAYKDGNPVTTATVVRYSMPIADSNGSWNADIDYFRDNYERYAVDQDNVSYMLTKAKEWPDITPTVFTRGAATTAGTAATNAPAVLNGLPSFSENMMYSNIAAAPIGKYATLLDACCGASYNPEDNSLKFIGVSADFSKNFTVGNNSIVFEEDPSMPRAWKVPLIDTTDIYQCGPDIMFTYDSATSEWDRIMTRAARYENGDKVDVVAVDEAGAFTGSTYVVTDVAVPNKDGGTNPTVPFDAAVIFNDAYLSKVKHAFLFVGAAILDHPYLRSSFMESGNLVSHYFGAGMLVGAGKKSTYKALLTALGSENTVASAIMRMTVLAAQQYQGHGFTQSSDVVAPNASYLMQNTAKALADSTSTTPDNDYELKLECFADRYGAVRPVVTVGSQNIRNYETPLPANGYNYPDDCYVGPYKIRSGKGPMKTIQGLEDDGDQGHLRSYLLPFLDKISFRPFVTDLTWGPHPSTKVTGPFSFAGVEKWLYALMIRTIVSFPGVEDLAQYWPKVAQLTTSPKEGDQTQLEELGSIPEIRLVTKPRIARMEEARSKGKSGNFRDETPGKVSMAVVSSDHDQSHSGANAASTTSRNNYSGSKSGGKHSKDNRGGKGSAQNSSRGKRDDADSGAADANFNPRSAGVTGPTGAQMTADYADPSIRKETKREKRVGAGVDETLAAMH